MRLRMIFRIMGALIFFLGLTMVFPLFFSLYYRDGDLWALILSAAITTGTGAFLFLIFRGTTEEIFHREGFAIVALGWASVAFFGSLPYMLAGVLPSFVEAYFEATSGFTTTGATVLAAIEEVPRGILFWRSLTHWLGGMGIIVLSIAILPFLGVGGMQLFRAEVPGGRVADKLKPRIAETAKILWQVYMLISAAETLLLMTGGMSLFEALCHTFGTMATGGFSTRNVSIGSYNKAYFDGIIVVFMILAGTNFSLHYQALTGNFRAFYRNSELRFYWATLAGAMLLVTLILRVQVYETLLTAFRYASFQVTSIMTTTGYTTADFEKWPSFVQYTLVVLMFIGGSAGSTGGGMKCMRILLLLKQGRRELSRLIHPHGVIPVRLGGKVVSDGVIQSVWGFFFLFILVFILASVGMSLLGLDIITAFVSVAATINNIGPGLGAVGPMDNYTSIPLIGKWILIFCMLIGRLELYTIIVLLVPEFWKR
ncbi:MAG: TrkH family potassium uptake protein [Syntrophobacterales bacterium]|nr:MAG: TrkH family potassium uptake protein [Syntrophobacterales bacterium]